MSLNKLSALRPFARAKRARSSQTGNDQVPCAIGTRHVLGHLARLSMTVSALVVLSGCAITAIPATPSPTASAVLRVRVGHSTTPGAAPTSTPPGPTPTASSPVPTATPDPFYNVTVRVVRADAPTKVVGELRTDARNGEASGL